MRKCEDEDCTAICDFCKHYQFNGSDLVAGGKTFKGAIYSGKGFCTYHHRKQDPSDHCENIKEVNEL